MDLEAAGQLQTKAANALAGGEVTFSQGSGFLVWETSYGHCQSSGLALGRDYRYARGGLYNRCSLSAAHALTRHVQS